MHQLKVLIGGSVTIPLLLLYNRRRKSQESLLYAREIDSDLIKSRKLQLSQVQIIFRHGARTPLTDFIENTNDTTFENVTWSKELEKTLKHTDVEISRHFSNGKVIRDSSLSDHHSEGKPNLKVCLTVFCLLFSLY